MEVWRCGGVEVWRCGGVEVWRACLVGHNVVVVAIGHDEAHVEQCLLEAGDERSASTPKHAAGVALKDTNGVERGLGAARGSPPVIGEVGGVVGAVDATDELTIFAISKRGLGRGRKGAERSYEGGQHQPSAVWCPRAQLPRGVESSTSLVASGRLGEEEGRAAHRGKTRSRRQGR